MCLARFGCVLSVPAHGRRISFGGGPTLSLISSALHFVYSMLENVIRRVRRLLLSGDYVVSEDWPAGNFRRWHSGTTVRSRFRLSDGGLALAFIRPFQNRHVSAGFTVCNPGLQFILGAPSSLHYVVSLERGRLLYYLREG